MRSDPVPSSEAGPAELTAQAATRAEPLPEERHAEHGDEDRHAEAEAILRDSEDRVAGATGATAPGDAADEHRRSEDVADG